MAHKHGFRAYSAKEAVLETANEAAGISSRKATTVVRFIADHSCFHKGEVVHLDSRDARHLATNGVAIII